MPRSAVIVPQRAVVGGVDRVQAEAGREHPVEGGRGAAALDVAEHRRARLLAGAALDLALEPVGDAAEADVAEGVELVAVAASGMPPFGSAPSATTMIGAKWLSKRRPTSSQTRSMSNWLLGDQDHVGAAGEAGVEGDPAGVAAHHLDDQDPVVAVGGGVQAVDRLHRDVDRGVEAEGVVGGAEVVVDRLRHPDDVDAVPPRCSREAAPSVSSPPIAIRPSTPSAARFSAIRSAPPSSAKGLVREEPRIVPPRGRMPRTSGTPSGRLSPSSGPRQPSR